ncbi:J domain-containing protein [Laspinema sp. A4]|uniref:J domain-containing protein n=1 Tax=Laspinema sp. D2d TaxID=2953686 RepID=UPI0021BA6BBC|nr:J domain-containing protein [Laspinema sp. D2d]MCT7984660.1 J domain-containing protein [Laspinema sp. D2d]
MNDVINPYETLRVSPQATQSEIKQAYRRLVKLVHPDKNLESSDSERMIQINGAYEILGDPQRRQSYDRRQTSGRSPSQSRDRQTRTAQAQHNYHHARQNSPDPDDHLEKWVKQVYQPINRMLYEILHTLQDEIDCLAADPFDDELMADFQAYLQKCRDFLAQAQIYFQSMQNPATVASVAANLYYCLDRIGDGIDELEFFTLNYDEHYLHTGQELFRIASGLRKKAHSAIKNVFG